MKSLFRKLSQQTHFYLKVITIGCFHFYSTNSLACMSIPRPFYVNDSTFSQEDFYTKFTKYGMALETGGDLIVFSQVQKKWCILVKGNEPLICSADLTGPNLTDSKTNEAIGYVDYSKDQQPCLLLYSLKANAKEKDTSRPYVRICDTSDVSNSENAFHSLGFNIELTHQGKVIGKGTSNIGVYLKPDNSFSEIKYRGFKISEAPLRFDITGNSFERSGCGATALKSIAGSNYSSHDSGSSSYETVNNNSHRGSNLLQSTSGGR